MATTIAVTIELGQSDTERKSTKILTVIGSAPILTKGHHTGVSLASKIGGTMVDTDTTTGKEHRNLTVGTFNIEYLGHRKGKGHFYLPDAIGFILESTPILPDIFAFPEATGILQDGETVLRSQLVFPLSEHLSDGWYEPFYAHRGVPGRRNHHHLLLLNNRVVKPLEWYDPGLPGVSDHTAGFATASVFGHKMWICCEHWQGGQGRWAFEAAANRVSAHAQAGRKTLLLGDFNATSSWTEEHLPDWQKHCLQYGEEYKLEQKGRYDLATDRWVLDTDQIDKLRKVYGYRDMGEEKEDPTPTTHPKDGELRIDRIFCSPAFPGRAEHYTVFMPPPELSDHAYVYGGYSVPCL